MFSYRQANKLDIAGMACLRAELRATQEYWSRRIASYLDGEHHPQQALMPRVAYVALQAGTVVGFIAGHLTRRLGCDGELEWINVAPAYQRQSVASHLFRLLRAWFLEQNAGKICVNVDPKNTVAKRFYLRHGAETLNEHWLVWNDISTALEKRILNAADRTCE